MNKILIACALAWLSGSNQANAEDPIAIAQRYYASFVQIASQTRSTHAQDFETYCRIIRDSFDVKFGISTISYYSNYYYANDNVVPADKVNLMLGYMVAYALEHANFFAKARANPSLLNFKLIGPPKANIISGVRVSDVTFTVLPGEPEITLTVNPNTGKVLNITTKGGLIKISGQELRNRIQLNDGWKIEDAINDYLKNALGTNAYNGIGCP